MEKLNPVLVICEARRVTDISKDDIQNYLKLPKDPGKYTLYRVAHSCFLGFLLVLCEDSENIFRTLKFASSQKFTVQMQVVCASTFIQPDEGKEFT